ncbi:MAG: tRNA pseudouridine(55) synthase TruB [Lachnospiraceae bacterium]|nr:tRNA pseudouridine(55) synthase TruB [Lachnospiraceae bacterium]
MDGIINVYKEAGFTSHDVVAKLRGILHQKKIGHTGTLDPAATGVLPVCCGKATKVCELLTDSDKSYRAVCHLGVVTDTQDMTGEILEEHSYEGITEEAIRKTVQEFAGETEQIPPMYSALKVNGKKLYELAREGKTIERKPRKISISEIIVSAVNPETGEFTMDVTCSKGTYIRTLCHDIGEKLGTGAAMAELLRTRVSVFSMDSAVRLSQIEDMVSKEDFSFLMPVDSLFPIYSRMQIQGAVGEKFLANGNPLSPDMLCPINEISSDRVLVYDAKDRFRAIYEKRGKLYRVVKMF